MPSQRIADDRIILRCVLLDEIADESMPDRYRSSLSADELERLQRINHVEVNRRFLVGRGLLRETLAECSGADPREFEFQYNAYGKPSLKTPGEPPLEFNVSHTRGLAMCAVATCGPLGVDVERERRVENQLGIARRVFAPAEMEQLERLSAERRDEAFLQIWTLREALVKARGVGLFTNTADFAFSLNRAHRPSSGEKCRLTVDAEVAVESIETCDITPEEWRFFRFRPARGYLAALAVNMRSQ